MQSHDDEIDFHAGFQLGEWAVYPLAGELRSGSTSVRIRPRVADVLVYLASNAGAVCERNEILRAVWGERAVSDDPLSRSVADLRECLGDSHSQQRYVQTIPKRGYRLVMPVAAIDPEPQQGAVAEDVGGPQAEILRRTGFEIVNDLGEHSKVRVLVANETSLDRTVVLKFLNSSLANDETARSRFSREARAAAKVQHPNVATIYQVSELPDGLPFLVEKHLSGETLAQVIDIEAPLTEPRVLAIGRDLASALSTVHAAGIVHRDFQPGNIIADRDGAFCVTDFGLAKVGTTLTDSTARLTAPGELIGHPRYMSPEQIRSEEISHKADIYSLGIVLYELATGRYPYLDVETGQGLYHADAEPIALGSQDVSERLGYLIMRCLAKDPVQRPSATQLVAQFELLRSGDPQLPAPAPTAAVGMTKMALMAAVSGAVAATAWWLLA